MGPFTYKQIEHHQVSRIFEYSFDVTSQEQWDQLRNLAKANGDEIDVIPEQAPSDPRVWFELLQSLPIEELAEPEEDRWTMRKGGFDVTEELLDEFGNEV